jgi:hypothetical protein
MTDADELSGPTSGSSKAGASINISFGDGAIVVNGNPSVSQLASLRAQITQIMEQAAIGFAAKAI